MRYLKEIEPYNRFWGNCITNMFISILLKDHPSYEPLIYINAYEYFSKDRFYLDYTMEFYNYFSTIFYFNRCNFINRKEFITELKEVLMNNPYLALNVDLFYWGKQGAYYNKIHTPHFSFIIGFDDDEEVIYVFEDDVNLHYAIREIPMKEVIQAFFSDYKDNSEDFRIITYKDIDIKPYTLDINKVIINAKNIIRSIDQLIENKCIVDKDALLTDISNVDFYGYEFGKISNRLSGNELLFEALGNDGIINEKDVNELILDTKEISNKWALVKNIFYKYCLRNKISEVDKLENMIIDLSIKEKEMWLKLIELSHH